MKVFEVLLIIFCVVVVLSVIINSVIRKKQGKSSCGSDCAKCSGCCNKKKNQ